MNLELGLPFWERVHGHAGWLAVAVLAHPAWILRDPQRRAPWATGLGTGSLSAVALAGAALYPRYRELVRPELFGAYPALGWWFERKEHLAVGALAFAWAGWVAHRASTAESRPPVLARLAHHAYAAAFVLALASAAIGTVVASARSF